MAEELGGVALLGIPGVNNFSYSQSTDDMDNIAIRLAIAESLNNISYAGPAPERVGGELHEEAHVGPH